MVELTEKQEWVEMEIEGYTVYVLLSVCFDEERKEFFLAIADKYAIYPVRRYYGASRQLFPGTKIRLEINEWGASLV